MRKSDKRFMRLLALLLVLPVLLCATLSMMAMATAEVIDPETYDGLVILEDPALIGNVEEDVADVTDAPVTNTPTDAPATTAPTDTPATDTPTTTAPTTPPTQAPTEPPAASYDILMSPPSGWYANRAAMEITISDLGGTGWSNVKITMSGSVLINGALPSGHLWLDLLDNCTLEVVVTDPYGEEHSKSVTVSCFDKTSPTLKASIKGEYLHAEAVDAESGIASIQVNGTTYTELTDGKLDILLKEYADAYEQLLVQAVDKVGNVSKAIALANPFFHNSPTTAPTHTPKPTNTSKPANTPKPTKKPSGGTSGGTGSGSGNGNNNSSGSNATATPTVMPTLVPTLAPAATLMPGITETQAGSPFSDSGNAYTRDLLYDKFTNKQFIAIETRSGDVFYMVIDYDKPLDAKGERYETYFLNLVDSRDLLDIVDSADIPTEPEVIYVTPEPTVVPAPSAAPLLLFCFGVSCTTGAAVGAGTTVGSGVT